MMKMCIGLNEVGKRIVVVVMSKEGGEIDGYGDWLKYVCCFV